MKTDLTASVIIGACIVSVALSVAVAAIIGAFL